MAHPVKCPPERSHPVTPTTQATTFPVPLVHFPELGVSHILSSFLIFLSDDFMFLFILFFYKILFIHERERDRDRDRDAGRG